MFHDTAPFDGDDGPLGFWLSSTLKTTAALGASSALLYPLARSWALYVGQRENIRLTTGNLTPASSELKYSGGLQTLIKSFRQEGFRAQWRGSLPYLLSIPFYCGSLVPLWLSRKWAENDIDFTLYGEDQIYVPQSMKGGFVFGAMLLNEALIQPFRYVWLRMAASPTTEVNIPTAKQIFQETVKNRGYRGLYTGFFAFVTANFFVTVLPIVALNLSPFRPRDRLGNIIEDVVVNIDEDADQEEIDTTVQMILDERQKRTANAFWQTRITDDPQSLTYEHLINSAASAVSVFAGFVFLTTGLRMVVASTSHTLCYGSLRRALRVQLKSGPRAMFAGILWHLPVWAAINLPVLYAQVLNSIPDDFEYE